MALQKIYIPRDARADLAAALREIRAWKRTADGAFYTTSFKRGVAAGLEMACRDITRARRLARRRAYREAIAMENIHQCETDA